MLLQVTHPRVMVQK